MLQYPMPLPPLSLRSRDNASGKDNSERESRRNPSAKCSRNDNVLSAYPAFAAFSHPHAIPVSSSSRTSQQDPPPSRHFLSSKLPTAPRSPVPRSPRPSIVGSSRPYSSISSRPSSASSMVQDILAPGDIIGEGIDFQGEPVRLVPLLSSNVHEQPAKEFEVVNLLGTGSYAVVYRVREVLSRRPSSEDSHSPLGRMDLDETASRPSLVEYGCEYAIKCLSKANLDEDALQAQLFEATIHQSLPAHPNIVTLYRTLETSSYLLLLLEYVPGEDLFYFLEQARDHYEPDPTSPDSSNSLTPPTPSLLSSLNPDQLLSCTRLRLISSMFSQMCDAVATCHNVRVFHRDIKPENFIVTDGWSTTSDGRQERRVVVKLSDFGLSTNDVESRDMDCGSAPYMSYECRNNVAPTYSPRAADVWSLGIVLINMLYHYNPWTDTAEGKCSSFELFKQQPVNFFMQRFTGMTQPVARFLATRVFCILRDSKDDSERVSAEEFGTWVKDLPSLFAVPGHARAVSSTSTQGHPISCGIPQSRPSSRQASLATVPRRGSRSMSRPASFAPAFEVTDLPTVLDNDNEDQEEEIQLDSRSTSAHKRRKRGARKKVKDPVPVVSAEPVDLTLTTLAEASQALARELSRTSKSSLSTNSLRVLPMDSSASVPPLPSVDLALKQLAPVVTKKPSKWKLSFGKSSGERPIPSPTPSSPVSEEFPASDIRQMSTTASNVTNLVLGLNPPSKAPPQTNNRRVYEDSSYSRGRRGRDHTGQSPYSGGPYIERWAHSVERRNVSPTSTRSGRHLASSASSMSSTNWRSPSAATSTSAFTRYSNNSQSTIATSVSSGSWRNASKSSISPSAGPVPAGKNAMPLNVKFMTGVPWELDELPRQMHPNPVGDIFGAPPQRKPRATRKPNDSKLDTISERPGGVTSSRPHFDASTSTTDLDNIREGELEGETSTPKKVQKGQINALAKMLSALRR